jgi:hypothetical protein
MNFAQIVKMIKKLNAETKSSNSPEYNAALKKAIDALNTLLVFH